MMYHHDEREYEAALSEAARGMRDALRKRIEDGRGKGAAAIRRVFEEVPDDAVVPGKLLDFQADEKGVFHVRGEAVHAHAFGQITEYARMPRAYVGHLVAQGPWGRELAAANLNAIYAHDASKHLFRSVKGQVRGFLSTRYQRRDPGQMLDAFVLACKKVGAVPYEAYAGDTKYMVKTILGRVIEPLKDEVIALGVVLHESPYGNGATEISPFIERCWCTNKAISLTELRKVHIGGRLKDDIEWSAETYAADTRAVCSQITDLVESQLGEANLHKLTEAVVEADARKVDHHKFEAFLKKALGKEDVEAVVAKYTSADIELLPKGNSAWRASNALSWYAGTLDDAEKAFEVQKLAGAALSAEIVKRA